MTQWAQNLQASAGMLVLALGGLRILHCHFDFWPVATLSLGDAESGQSQAKAKSVYPLRTVA
jgi:hypothetical protein